MDLDPFDIEKDHFEKNPPSDQASYLPCAAHNIQLFLKDGLKMDAAYTALIKKVAKNIVSKSKFSD
jgi:hypothetical protein